jgi:hypothetical protein
MNATVENLVQALSVAEQFVRKNNLPEWENALHLYQDFMRKEEFWRLKYLWRIFAPTCAWDDLSATLPQDEVRQASQVGESLFQAVEHLRIELGIDPRSWSFDD